MSDLYPSDNDIEDDDVDMESQVETDDDSGDLLSTEDEEEDEIHQTLSPAAAPANNSTINTERQRRNRLEELENPRVFSGFSPHQRRRINELISPATITRGDFVHNTNLELNEGNFDHIHNTVMGSDNIVMPSGDIGPTSSDIGYVPSNIEPQLDNDPINFIAANTFIGNKDGMKWGWGPFGLGYYTNIPDSCIKMYKNTRNNYNKLSKEKREIYHKFLSNIFDFGEDELVIFFSMLGLKKICFFKYKFYDCSYWGRFMFSMF